MSNNNSRSNSKIYIGSYCFLLCSYAVLFIASAAQVVSSTTSSQSSSASVYCKFCDIQSHLLDPELTFQNIYCVDWDWFASFASPQECLIIRSAAVKACGCPIQEKHNYECTNICPQGEEINTTKPIKLVGAAPELTCGDVLANPSAVDGIYTCDYFRRELSPICCINSGGTNGGGTSGGGTRGAASSSSSGGGSSSSVLESHDKRKQKRISVPDFHNDSSKETKTATPPKAGSGDPVVTVKSLQRPPPSGIVTLSSESRGDVYCKFCDTDIDNDLTFQNIPCADWEWVASFASPEECLILRSGAATSCGCPVKEEHNYQCPNLCPDDQEIDATKNIGRVSAAPFLTCGDILSNPLAVDGRYTCDYFRRELSPVCCVDNTLEKEKYLQHLTEQEQEKEKQIKGRGFGGNEENLDTSVCQFCDKDIQSLSLDLDFANIPCIEWDLFASFATPGECLIIRAGAVAACGCPIPEEKNHKCDICLDGQDIHTEKRIGLVDDAPSLTCGDVISYPAVDGDETCDYFRRELAPICCSSSSSSSSISTSSNNHPVMIKKSLGEPIQEVSHVPTNDSVRRLEKCTLCPTSYEHQYDSTAEFEDVPCDDWSWFAHSFATHDECLILRAGAAEACGCMSSSRHSYGVHRPTPCNDLCAKDQVVDTHRFVNVLDDAPFLTCGDVFSYPAVDGAATCDYIRRKVSPICCIPPSPEL